MNNYTFYIKRVVWLLLVFPFVSIGQTKRDSLSLKLVNVVKSYAPIIADAYKKREDANIKKDSVLVAKKQIDYSIYSVPVASTFVPEKGKATMIVQKGNTENYMNSYVAGAFGNLNTLFADASLNLPITKESNIALIFNHLSSNADVKDVIPSTNYANTSGQLRYDFLNPTVQWGINADFGRRMNNFYGVQKDFYTDEMLRSLNGLKRTYLTYGVGGYLKLATPYFKGINLSLSGLSDSFKSSEINFKALPTAELELDNEHKIRANILFNYYKSNFSRDAVFSPSEINNQWVIFGLNPSYHFTVDNIDLKLGATVAYAGGNANFKSEFKAYPDVEVSYRLLETNTIFHGGIRGMLQQNTIADLTKINPYLAPFQYVIPTSVPVDVFAGVRGEVANNIFYKAQGSYKQFENLPLFTTFSEVGTASLTMAYQHHNTFKTVYDKVSNFEFLAGIDGNVNNFFFFDFEAKLNSYKAKNQQEAWNLPPVKVSLFTDFQVIENLKVGVDTFYVGSRFDLDYEMPTVVPTKKTLSGYFDLNLHADYTYRNNWNFFVKANNLTSSNYERFLYYPVHGLQVFAGVKYLFNLKIK